MVSFIADEIKIKLGHRVDHSPEVILVSGEYQTEEISKLAQFIGKTVKVTIEEA